MDERERESGTWLANALIAANTASFCDAVGRVLEAWKHDRETATETLWTLCKLHATLLEANTRLGVLAEPKPKPPRLP